MKHWDAFKAGEAAYVDTEGNLRAAIDAACTIAYAEGRKDEAEANKPEKPDRTVCFCCGGRGEVRMYDAPGEKSYWAPCDNCEGVGYFGPDV